MPPPAGIGRATAIVGLPERTGNLCGVLIIVSFSKESAFVGRDPQGPAQEGFVTVKTL